MIRAFALAFAQLLDPRVVKLAIVSVIVTLAIYGLLIAGLVTGLSHAEISAVPWLDSLARWGGGLGAVLLATLLFPGVVTAVMSLWQEQVIAAVEARHYPGLPPPQPAGLAASLGAALRLLGLTLAVNLALLPLYLALLFLPPLNAALFAAANGLLLGREYADAVALRRLSPAGAAALRRQGRARFWLGGTATALLLTVPGVNLIAPVVATAAFVHLVESLRTGTVLEKLTQDR
jgi:uncharacterized protein involved in cysteine biosynthesis